MTSAGMGVEALSGGRAVFAEGRTPTFTGA